VRHLITTGDLERDREGLQYRNPLGGLGSGSLLGLAMGEKKEAAYRKKGETTDL